MSTSLSLALAVSAGVAAGVFSIGSAGSLAGRDFRRYGVSARPAGGWRPRKPRQWVRSAPPARDRRRRATSRLYPPLRRLLKPASAGSLSKRSISSGTTPFEIEADSRRGDRKRRRESCIESGALDRRVSEPASGGGSITVAGVLATEAASDWRAGRWVRMPAVLRRPARYLNQGVADQELLLARRGIALVGSAKSAALVQVVERGRWFDEWASAIRGSVRGALARHVSVRDPQSGAVAVAILIGDRGLLDPDVEQRLQEAGTYHVIAISGGNIAILAALILAALWAMGIRGGWAAGAAVALLAAYAHLAGAGPSVLRATVMAAIYLSLRVNDQRTAPRHAMALTAAAVRSSPLSIADVGLWLTRAFRRSVVGASHPSAEGGMS